MQKYLVVAKAITRAIVASVMRSISPKKLNPKVSKYADFMRDKFCKDTNINNKLILNWGNFQANNEKAIKGHASIINQNKIFVSIENPIIGRATFEDRASRDKGYFRVALHNSSARNHANFALPKKASDTRLKKILKDTSTKIKPYRKNGRHILYAMQVPYDTSTLGLNMFVAAQYDIMAIKKNTDRPVIITVSPASIREPWANNRLRREIKTNYKKLKYLAKLLNIVIYDKFEKQDTTSAMFLKNCWAVVCHSSGFAVEAMLEGVPVITLHSANFMYPVCSHEINEIENPQINDRIPWLSRLAYCQWTLDEIENGDAYRHLKPEINKLLNLNLKNSENIYK